MNEREKAIIENRMCAWCDSENVSEQVDEPRYWCNECGFWWFKEDGAIFIEDEKRLLP